MCKHIMRVTLGLALLAFLFPLNALAGAWIVDQDDWQAAMSGVKGHRIEVDFSGIQWPGFGYDTVIITKPWGTIEVFAAYAEGWNTGLLIDGVLTITDFSRRIIGVQFDCPCDSRLGYTEPGVWDSEGATPGFWDYLDDIFDKDPDYDYDGFAGYIARDLRGVSVWSTGDSISVTLVAAAPEPSTALLLALAIGGVLGLGWRRKGLGVRS